MDFKIRPSGYLLLKVFVAAGGLLLGSYNFFSAVFKSGVLHYNYIVYFLMGVSATIQIYRDLSFLFSNTTVLTINKDGIHDYYNDVVYNWSDIAGIRQKYGYLYLNLYKPQDYLGRIGNWNYRMLKKFWYKPNGKHNEFLVNISLADANKDKLSKLVTEYSVNKKLNNGI